LSQCNGARGNCDGCCRQDYSGSCTDYFSGTSGFGWYFRTVKHYGKVKRYKPDCDGSTGGGGDGTRCQATCDRARAAGLQACRSRKSGCDPAAIETAYQECIAACASG